MKVSGNHIKALLEVETTATVLKRLDEWGIKQKGGYVLTEHILSYLENPGDYFVPYKAKSKGSERI